MLRYALTVTLSAFLLFQVQPLLAKSILPWFGGAAAVWSTCILFFQAVLLAGYGYAHALHRYLPPRRQALVHVLLLAASLAFLPATPATAWKPAPGDEPASRILLLLTVTVGLPYFLLSTTAPLLQAWFARDPRMAGRSPYRLYALSNTGSMLALLSYPPLVEPFLNIRQQAAVWSVSYLVFAALAGWAAFQARGHEFLPPHADMAPEAAKPSLLRLLVWTALAACASSLMLSITDHISQNVAAIPFLWILPLAVYLLSFILCFDAPHWYRRGWFLRLFAVLLGAMVYALQAESGNLPIKVAIPLFVSGLFVCCMVCHGELVRLKPAPRHLTLFYLSVAIGGACGGLFAGILAPRLFRGYFELPVSLAATAALVLILLRRDPSFPPPALPRRFIWAALLVLHVAFNLSLLHLIGRRAGGVRVALRNFYGGLRVEDEDSAFGVRRQLTHGTITHGEQYLAASRRSKPLTYYGYDSGIGRALLHYPHLQPLHVGVVGLGAGTLAAYGKPGDRYRFYEINPLVADLARSQFFYLRDSKAEIHIILGDARLSLENESNQSFDILAIDAFSSDSIPVHLLTREAFDLYFRHLKPSGVLAVHVSNRYLDLRPVVAAVSSLRGRSFAVIDTEDDEADPAVFGCTWILVSADAGFFQRPAIRHAAAAYQFDTKFRVWTDDYSNLFRILK